MRVFLGHADLAMRAGGVSRHPRPAAAARPRARLGPVRHAEGPHEGCTRARAWPHSRTGHAHACGPPACALRPISARTHPARRPLGLHLRVGTVDATHRTRFTMAYLGPMNYVASGASAIVVSSLFNGLEVRWCLSLCLSLCQCASLSARVSLSVPLSLCHARPAHSSLHAQGSSWTDRTVRSTLDRRYSRHQLTRGTNPTGMRHPVLPPLSDWPWRRGCHYAGAAA
jgi:hypothetical protein